MLNEVCIIPLANMRIKCIRHDINDNSLSLPGECVWPFTWDSNTKQSGYCKVEKSLYKGTFGTVRRSQHHFASRDYCSAISLILLDETFLVWLSSFTLAHDSLVHMFCGQSENYLMWVEPFSSRQAEKNVFLPPDCLLGLFFSVSWSSAMVSQLAILIPVIGKSRLRTFF